MSNELPLGVVPVGDPDIRTSGFGLDGIDDIQVTYKLGDQWEVRLTAVRAEGMGTMFSRIEFMAADGVGESINSQALRLVPFRHAKAWVDRELVRVIADDAVGVVPTDYSTITAYADLARCYDWFVEYFPDRPLIQLGEYAGVNRNTLAARIDRAKALGFLARESKMHPFRMTEAAAAALHEGDDIQPKGQG